MKKYKLIISLVVLMICSLFSGHTASADDLLSKWKGFDIRTKASEGVTAEKIDKLFAKNGSGGKLVGQGKKIMAAAEANGINPAFIAGQMAFESAWGKSNLAMKNNNFGGIRSKSGFPKDGNGWSIFSSVDEGIKVQAELLKDYTEGKIGSKKLTSFWDILQVYAPSFENDQSLYVSVVAGTMDKLGQTPDGSLAKGTGEYKDDKTQVGERTKGINFFMEPALGRVGSTGIDSGDSVIGSDALYGFGTFSKKTYGILLIIGMVLAAILFVYMSVTAAMYAAAVKGLASGVAFEKMSGIKDDVYGKRTFTKLVIAMVIGFMLCVIFMTGLYISLMGAIYQAVMYAWSLLFGG
ncbi:glucosaminidase domain-containing protein [Bacillus sp. S17B2]|uniref:glucosaminidase domain-containing protein n=1 Tax=unclassified Bacillus (in: firmicutes) TaxID=185979 RepID=UPI00227E9F9B|nr:glucosaminidase domain-containing protein [Bacillus sp. S17B2]